MTDALLSVPIGTIIDFAGPNNPTGYLECNGSAVSRTTYAALFVAIGTTWGSGDGSTTFNLPDLRGRTSIGAGTGTAGGATAHSLAGKGGDQRMRNHKHTMDSSGSTTTGAGSNHSHGMTHSHWMTLNNYGSSAGSGINWQYWSAGGSNRCGTYQNNNDMIKNYSGNTGGESAHTHSVPNHTHTMQNAGGGSQSENEANMQPYAVVRKLIRAA